MSPSESKTYYNPLMHEYKKAVIGSAEAGGTVGGLSGRYQMCTTCR